MATQDWSPPTADEERLAEATGAVRVSEEQWSEGHCPNPNHDDATPSFGFRRGEKRPIVVNCFGCDDWDGLKAGLADIGLDTANVARSRRNVRRPTLRSHTLRRSRTVAKPKPEPLEDQGKPPDWSAALLDARYPQQLAYLERVRGLTRATLRAFTVGFDAQRFTIPIYVGGQAVNVRRYSPTGSPKMLNLDGHGSNVLAFTEVLDNAPDAPVIVTEGEWDALLVNQIGDGAFVAVTGTAGAGSVPDLSLLAGREVFVALDTDKKGRESAPKWVAAAAEVARAVHTFDLTRLGLPSDDKDRKDWTDYVVQLDGTAESVVAEIERLRDEDAPIESDNVLAEIERLFLAEDDARQSLIADVRSDDDILAMTPARFAVESWLPVGFFADMFGEPGAKKTFVILDLLRHVRAGLPWHGNTVTAGATLLFEGEGLEQLQGRIIAWDEHNDNPPLAPGGSISTPVDLTTPEGIARVVRTVRDFERENSTSVVVVAFDPLVEYMNGEEVGEGMELATRGLRALARYLDIAVLVGAHTNASGDRARGSDHLRMRSGAHVRVETLKDDLIGLVQEKQKNGERRALILQPVPVGSSLALSSYRNLSAAEYYASKDSTEHEQRASARIVLSEVQASAKRFRAEELLLRAVRASPGIVTGKLLGACKSQGVGNDLLKAALGRLVDGGQIRTEQSGTARNAPIQHFPADPSEASEP
jgi:hypothetical protein